MRQKKYLAVLVCLAFGFADAFACAGCSAWWDNVPVPASVTGDNVRMYTDIDADARFWFFAPNRVSVYNLPSSFWGREHPELRKSGTYRIIYEYGVPFIHFAWDAHTSPRVIGNRFLILRHDEFILLYNSNTEPAFRALYKPWLVPVRLWDVRASATLTMGHLHFDATPERLGTHINRVWAVEGGVGERLYIPPIGTILVSIGYVHYSRPYLFQANSRPKRLRFSQPHNEQSFEVELEDTPHYQTIRKSELSEWRWWDWRHEVIVEILEIRPGFRYNHMCINSIMWLEDRSP